MQSGSDGLLVPSLYLHELEYPFCIHWSGMGGFGPSVVWALGDS